MGKPTSYDGEIAKLEEQQDRLGVQINNLKQLRAEQLCPHKVGDIITNKEGTRQAKIAKITHSWNDYKMIGCWLKKDGSLGSQLHELYWFEWA